MMGIVLLEVPTAVIDISCKIKLAIGGLSRFEMSYPVIVFI